jgi:hypothetical protein
MGIKWNKVKLDLRQQIEKYLLLRVKNFNEIDFTCFLIGAMEMNYKWFEHNNELKETVLRELFKQINNNNSSSSAHQLTAEEEMNLREKSSPLLSVLSQLQKIGLIWNHIPQEHRDKFFQKLESRCSSFSLHQISSVLDG